MKEAGDWTQQTGCIMKRERRRGRRRRRSGVLDKEAEADAPP